jgi:plasmid stabilization system protein ParE
MVESVFQVVFSRKAMEDLRRIVDYLSQKASKSVGEQVRYRILDQAESLQNLPESKPILPGIEDFEHEVRYTKAWSYKIIFRIFHPTNTVRILTIRHDKEDPEDIISKL